MIVAKEDTRTATAYHEAGHAVMAFLAGVTINSISIIADEGSNGRVHHRNPLRHTNLDDDTSDRAYDRARKMIRICLAGSVAESLFERSFSKDGSGADYETAVEIAVRLTGSAVGAKPLIELQLRQVFQIMKENWRLVETLAGELLIRSEMSGSDVDDFLRMR